MKLGLEIQKKTNESNHNKKLVLLQLLDRAKQLDRNAEQIENEEMIKEVEKIEREFKNLDKMTDLNN